MKIYLAGPDVFRGDIIGHFSKAQKLCEQYLHIPLLPDFFSMTAEERFIDNIQRIDLCDCVIANLNPFRGYHMDDGTAMEIGYAYAKGKLIWGYTDFANIPLINQIPSYSAGKDFPVIEDFNRPVNLMIYDAIQKSGGKILLSFEDVLKQL